MSLSSLPRPRTQPLPPRPVSDSMPPAIHVPAERERRRRVLNVTLALVGLVLAAPLMLVIAVLVRLTSPGPVFFTQPRVGLDRRNGTPPRHISDLRRVDWGGSVFKIYKFRTMYVDRGGDDQVWAQPNDPRVTPVGRVLRAYRLDELPQLINVLKGDMNVVGPRPEQPDIFRSLREGLEDYQERQRVRPGITGWAQVNHHYAATLKDTRVKLTFDLAYLRRCSALEDLRILLMTVPVVLFKRGAW